MRFTPGGTKSHGLCSQVSTSGGSPCIGVPMEAGEEAEPAAVSSALVPVPGCATSGPAGAGGE